MEKPYAESCERNKEDILRVLQSVITPANKRLLEFSGGTGQHAVFLAPHFPHLEWNVSEQARNHLGMSMWLREAKVKNIKGPIHFELGKDEFPKKVFDLVFTANTLHIMSWKKNKLLFKTLGKRLRRGAQVLIYGPFNYGGKFISEGNEKLDAMVKKVDSESGIRNFEDICKAMLHRGFSLVEDHALLNNNHMLHFIREEHRSSGA